MQAVCPLLGLADTGFLWNSSEEEVTGNHLSLSLRLILAFETFVYATQSLWMKLGFCVPGECGL